MNADEFWEIIHQSKSVANGNVDLQEKILTEKLAKYSAEEIINFEIILRQLIDEADDYQVLAAQKIIKGWVSDDSYLYFRCWLIAQGKDVFYNTLKNADFLADIVNNSEEVDFEELLYIATNAYRLKSGKQEEDNSFPRVVADEKHSELNYDLGGSETKGEEWNVSDLPKLYPKLCSKFEVMPDASKDPVASFKALLAKFNLDPDLSDNPNEALKAALKMLNHDKDERLL